MYYIDEDKSINYSDADYYIKAFCSSELNRLKKLDDYYKNKNQKIRMRTFDDASKPNNKLYHSFADYIVTTNTAVFLGSPVTYSSDTRDITEYLNILNTADEEGENIKIATACAEYGYGIQLLYLDKEGVLKFHTFDNKEVVLIYSNSIEKNLIYAVRFWTVTTVDNIQTNYVEIYSKESIRKYRNGSLIEETANIFTDIPIVVYENNDIRRGDFENIVSLIDAYDYIESDTINEQDYFNNAYLFFNTDYVDTEDIKKMKESRVFYGENLNPQFILKQSSNNEEIKNRIVSDIHKLSFTPDMSDNNFANNVSGVAMRYKLLGTLNNISNKQRKFKKSIIQRNKLIFEYMEIKSLTVPDDIKIIFTINLPENVLETAQTINQLRNLVSDETLLSQIPFVTDVDKEVERVKEANSIDIYGGGLDD